MGFVKSSKEIANNFREKVEYYDAEVLTVFFETNPEIVERLLPPPLKPTESPLGFVFVANYPRTNLGVSYLESALFLQAEFNGEIGNYCLAMPVTDDMAMVGGREIFGFPQKIGNIYFNRNGKEVEGWTGRHGTRIMQIRAKLTGKFNVEEAQGLFMENLNSGANTVVYNFKYFPAPEREGFDYSPRLIREEIESERSSLETGEAELILRSSDRDPWGDVEIVRLIGAVYAVSNNTMLPGNVVAEVDPVEFAPYASLKWDW